MKLLVILMLLLTVSCSQLSVTEVPRSNKVIVTETVYPLGIFSFSNVYVCDFDTITGEIDTCINELMSMDLAQ